MEESIDFDNDLYGGSMVMDSLPNLQGKDGSSNAESIKVLVRIRPLNEKEISTDGENTTMSLTSNNSLTIRTFDSRKTYNCSYDTIIPPTATQSQVYDHIKDCTLSVMQGVNSTIFAYGQTGSGKTYSMYGPPSYVTTAGGHAHSRDTELLGVIPRAIHHIFELAKNPKILQLQVHCSFVQIYNENLFDMLRDSSMNTPLTIREESTSKEIYVQGLSEYNVKSVFDTLQLLKIAEENRAIRETHMNQFSSRSHSIFTISIEQKCVALDGGEISYRSKFNLVDLAGSEKWDLSKDLRDEHIQEMNNINLSLHTLGKCISSLAKISRRQRQHQLQKTSNNNSHNNSSNDIVHQSTESAKTKQSNNNDVKGVIHVPFRESKLTRLLQDSLGGNAKTFLIATISPARINADESISTLKFADRAKQVMVTATINESRPVDHALVQRLQQEMALWKSIVKKVIGFNGPDVIQAHLTAANSGVTSAEFLLSETEIMLTQALTKEINFSTSAVRKSQQQQHPPQPSITGSRNSPIGATHGSSSIASSSYLRYSSDEDGDREERENISEQHQNTSVVPGGGLEYVISLEKALNKEQIHAQHLTKKNETLIKEIEELKVLNLQLSFNPNNNSHNHNHNHNHNNSNSHNNHQIRPFSSSSSSGHGNNDGLLLKYTPQLEQLSSNLSNFHDRTEICLSYHEKIEKVMRKFFKFQIEEEEMKQDLLKVFDAVKQLRGGWKVSSLRDDSELLLTLLEELKVKSSPRHQPSQGGGGGGRGFGVTSAANTASKQQQQANHTSIKPRNLPQLNQPNPSQSQANNQSYHQPNHHQQKSTVQIHADDIDEYAAPLSSGYHGMKSVSTSNLAPPTSSAGISFRVRGAPPTNVSSEGSLGWTTASQQLLLEEAEDEEERLKEELKKAKKKQKQKDKLNQWAREKEERALMDLKAQEEERKAMQEAELLREAKRKEYAMKQKQKLQGYQEKVDKEKQKIQQLLDLGIDPKSLNI